MTEGQMLTAEQMSNRVKWIEALLSGDYPQGNGKLLTQLGYCCLGVAAAALTPDADFIQKTAPQINFLPDDWAESKLGLSSSKGADDQFIAGTWNDRAEYTFVQIADRVALATEHNLRFNIIDASELDDTEPGDYAREWLSRQA